MKLQKPAYFSKKVNFYEFYVNLPYDARIKFLSALRMAMRASCAARASRALRTAVARTGFKIVVYMLRRKT